MCVSALHVPYIADCILRGCDPDSIMTDIFSSSPGGDVLYNYYSAQNLPAMCLLSTQATTLLEEENPVY